MFYQLFLPPSVEKITKNGIVDACGSTKKIIMEISANAIAD